jgi:hypothetical protein
MKRVPLLTRREGHAPARLRPDIASLADLPPVSGLYCCPVAGLACAVLGPGRQLATLDDEQAPVRYSRDFR